MNIDEIDEIEEAVDSFFTPRECANCGVVNIYVSNAPCMTAYADEEMNKTPLLCEECTEGHIQYWEDMWAEYYSSRI